MRFQSLTSVFKFLCGSVEAKHLVRFDSETSVFKFLWHSVDAVLRRQTKAVGVEQGRKKASKRKIQCMEKSRIHGLI